MEEKYFVKSFPTQRPKGAQTPSNCHISPKCWQNISNTNIFILLTHVSQPSARRAHRHPPTVIYPPIVGRIYPIQIYIFSWHIFPNCWQCISNINVYSSKFTFPHPAPEGRTNTLQLTHIFQLLAEYIRYSIVSYNFIGVRCRPLSVPFLLRTSGISQPSNIAVKLASWKIGEPALSQRERASTLSLEWNTRRGWNLGDWWAG